MIYKRKLSEFNGNSISSIDKQNVILPINQFLNLFFFSLTVSYSFDVRSVFCVASVVLLFFFSWGFLDILVFNIPYSDACICIPNRGHGPCTKNESKVHLSQNIWAVSYKNACHFRDPKFRYRFDMILTYKWPTFVPKTCGLRGFSEISSQIKRSGAFTKGQAREWGKIQ